MTDTFNKALSEIVALRAAVARLTAERDEANADLRRVTDEHLHCAAFDDQPGPCTCRAGWLSPEVASEVRAALERLVEVGEESYDMDMGVSGPEAVTAARAALARLGGAT